MFNELFIQIALVILVAGGLSLIAHRLKQPLIVAYILTGIIVGPGILGIAQAHDIFAALSQIGIAFLLFTVGLHLNWRNVKEVGRAAVLGGFAQVIVTSLVGFGIGQALGFSVGTSAFVGIAFSFSSTIIIVKLLQDKEDLDRLYGRIAVGILIVQDLIAMFILLAVAAIRDGGSIGDVLTTSALKGVAVLAVLFVLARFALPRIMRFAAASQELLFLATLAWCFGVASALQLLGFGIEIGALLAGISLASSGYHHEIESKIRPLRDFFLIIFFIVLGTQLTVDAFASVWIPAVIMSLYVLIGNPLIATFIMRAIGYHPRVAFMTGTTVGQISEFSFILLAGGIAAGLVTSEVLPLATLVALLTIGISSYIISYNDRVYDRVAFLFAWMAHEPVPKDGAAAAPPAHVLFGYHRMGESIYAALRKLDSDIMIVDYNPLVVQTLTDKGVQAMYGDAGSMDLLQFLQLHKTKMVISTVPDMNVNYDVLEYLKQHKYRGAVIVTARVAEEAARCYALGASYVIIPNVLGGAAFAQYLTGKYMTKTAWQGLARKHRHPTMR